MTTSRISRYCGLDHAVAVDVIVVAQHRTPLELHVISRDPQSAVVQVSGEIDASNAAAVNDVLVKQSEQGRRIVRLDLSRLTFCDCAGLGVIVQAHHRMLAADGSLVLTGVYGIVARLLAITHLDGALHVAGAARGRR